MKKEDLGKKYLPIGTVVMLKGGTKRIMITGFYVTEQGSTTVYDYSGCLYPQGMFRSDQVLLFNHKQIDEVYHLGLVDEEEKEFKKYLKDFLKKKDRKEDLDNKKD